MMKMSGSESHVNLSALHANIMMIIDFFKI